MWVEWILTLLDPGHLCILRPKLRQFDVKSINQKPVNIFSQNFVHMLTSILVHIWVKKITNKKKKKNSYSTSKIEARI